jgi:hypothetical protein
MLAATSTIANLPVADLAIRCRQIVALYQVPSMGYRPIPQHLFFFALVWSLKQRVAYLQRVGADASLAEPLEQIAQHLEVWGTAVSALKEKDEHEWELLRIQIEKAVETAARDYQCQARTDVKAEAIGNGLTKVFEILHKLPAADTLEATADLIALAVDRRDEFTNLYDFSSPFYPFVRRIARNELITLLRRERRETARLQPLEETAHTPVVPPPMPEEDEEVAYKAAQRQLKIVLCRLLELVQTQLTPKPRLVVLQTLAARPQFWRALSLIELSAPAGFPPPTEPRNDAELGTILNLSENSVRVHRFTAKKCIQVIDPKLGQLLERLMTLHP